MNKIIADYVWIDSGNDLRYKTKILPNGDYSIANIPEWSFDGMYTKQATNQNPILVLKPVQLYKNPFYSGYTVLCEVHVRDDLGERPHPSNSRLVFLDKSVHLDYIQPQYKLTIEFYINVQDVQDSKETSRDSLIKNYAGFNVRFRNLIDTHLEYCLQAGIDISSTFHVGGTDQWSFSVGPTFGIKAIDDLVIGKYILKRLAERLGVGISFHPCPLGKDNRGSACLISYSTMQTRFPGGYNEIQRIINKLKLEHSSFISICGEDTHKRLTGEDGTSTISNFSHGVGTTNTSIRIPYNTFRNKRGCFEDRRPSANADLYKVCLALFLASTPE
jgi:glutamine synthetase